MSKEWLIFVLGTNNWQGPGQFAPGSGILHQGQHIAMNSLPNATCYSIWPSDILKSPKDKDDYRVYEIPHPIPICESVGPQSSKRWHSMSDAEVSDYCNNLKKQCVEFIEYIEKKHNKPVNLFLAHHCFMNPVVMSEINAERVANGKTKVPLVVFAHGTALKMYENEIDKLPEYPMKYYTWMREKEKVFESAEKVSGVFAISAQQKSIFQKLFPHYPHEHVAITPMGYNNLIFHAIPEMTRMCAFGNLPQILYDNFDSRILPDEEMKRVIGPNKLIPDVECYKHVVVFCGRFADWKRLDCVLHAAQLWEKEAEQRQQEQQQTQEEEEKHEMKKQIDNNVECQEHHVNDKQSKSQNILTLIIGSGSQAAREEYVNMAYKDLHLHHTFFLGPQSQQTLADIYTVSDLGVFPSKEEPFGLVFIECMGCGTPVIGAQSGGPLDFVNNDVGTLVKEGSNSEVSQHVYEAVKRALNENWKAKKGEKCKEYAMSKFSLNAQAKTMLHFVETHFLQ